MVRCLHGTAWFDVAMTTAPPDTVTQDLAKLAAALDTTIPARTESNLLIATWNVRAFGDLTDKWTAGPRDSPKRDFHIVACIAGIVSRFDAAKPVAWSGKFSPSIQTRVSHVAISICILNPGHSWANIVLRPGGASESPINGIQSTHTVHGTCPLMSGPTVPSP
jgi:hypothetical protein